MPLVHSSSIGQTDSTLAVLLKHYLWNPQWSTIIIWFCLNLCSIRVGIRDIKIIHLHENRLAIFTISSCTCSDFIGLGTLSYSNYWICCSRLQVVLHIILIGIVHQVVTSLEFLHHAIYKGELNCHIVSCLQCRDILIGERVLRCCQRITQCNDFCAIVSLKIVIQLFSINKQFLGLFIQVKFNSRDNTWKVLLSHSHNLCLITTIR